jgi:hypothetical protein
MKGIFISEIFHLFFSRVKRKNSREKKATEIKCHNQAFQNFQPLLTHNSQRSHTECAWEIMLIASYFILDVGKTHKFLFVPSDKNLISEKKKLLFREEKN